MTASFEAEIAKFAAQACIVVAGWWVVNLLTVRRERDKARRELIVKNADALADAADKIFEAARKYHFAADRDVLGEITLKISLQDFGYRTSQLQTLTGDPTSANQLATCVARVRRSITHDHFEDQHDGSLDPTSDASQEMAAAVMEVKESLQALKHQQFPAPSSWTRRARK
jgi:hypothetical protein